MLLRCCSVLAVLLLTAWPVFAQPDLDHPFYPLGIGDTWEYELAYGDIYHPVDLVSYQRRTVLRDTMLSGEAYRLVRVDSISADPGYDVLAEALCAVRVTDTTRVEWTAVDESGGGACWAPEVALGLDLSEEPSSAGIFVNGERYALDRLRVRDTEYPGRTVEAVEGIGLLSYARGKWDETVQDDRVVLRVIYAEVEGEVYGHPIGSDVWKTFYPLNHGDVREYKYNGSGPEGNALLAYERWDVGADSTIDGVDYTLVRQRRYDEQSDLNEERTCALRLTEEGGVEALLIGGSGRCSTRVGWDLRTNTWAIALRGVLGTQFPVKRYQKFDDSSTSTMDIAMGLGVTRTYWSDNQHGSGGRGGYTLVYAVVDGTTYGERVIDPDEGDPDEGDPAEDDPAEDEPAEDEPAEDTSLPAAFVFHGGYPSPFQSAVTLAFDLSVREEVSIGVFDTLGRQVLHRNLGVQPVGPSRHRLDLSGTPAGLYIVQMMTGSGETASRRIVRVN